MPHYATTPEFTAFFAKRGIEVKNVRRDRAAHVRLFTVNGHPMELPMDASPEMCLHLVRAQLAALSACSPPLPPSPK